MITWTSPGGPGISRRPIDDVSTNQDTLVIAFRDTDIGISLENQSKLFKLLFTTQNIGQGIGLIICKRTVEVHSGEITVERQVRKCSAFTVKLPIKREVIRVGEEAHPDS